MLDHTNVAQRLQVRDFMDDLRGAGVSTGGPPPYGPKDKAKPVRSTAGSRSHRVRQALIGSVFRYPAVRLSRKCIAERHVGLDVQDGRAVDEVKPRMCRTGPSTLRSSTAERPMGLE